MSTSPHAKSLLKSLFDAAVERAQPQRVLPAAWPQPPRGRTVVIGAGKASAAMGAAVEAAWPAHLPLGGLVITRYGHVPPAARVGERRIACVEAGHPVPDHAGACATARLLSLLKDLTADDLVICLISGGGSALLAAPLDGLTLHDEQVLNEALLCSGAGIDEMNTLRKHLSAVKGGRLALQAGAAQVVTLVISDVPGDDPATIASGPTVPDPTTCADAWRVAQRYRIALAPAAIAGLRSGAFETPKPGDPRFARHRVEVIATPRASLEAAAERARSFGVPAHILGDDLQGESRDVAQAQAALACAVADRGEPFRAPCVLLSGGETTVTLRDAKSGRGGRAGEFTLACALALRAHPKIHVLAADTDGIDGVQDNAGAYAGPDTLARAAALNLVPHDHLEAHDAYGVFDALGDSILTGPTYTNVNDFRAVLIES